MRCRARPAAAALWGALAFAGAAPPLVLCQEHVASRAPDRAVAAARAHVAAQAPFVIVPIANHDDNQHAPDENLRLRNLFDGIALVAALLTME